MFLASISDIWVVALVGMISLAVFATVLLITIVANQRRFVTLHRESETRLRESEEHFRHLIEHSPLPMWCTSKIRSSMPTNLR